MLIDLQLKNFRCFESLSVQFSPAFNFFIGANGEGKSSLLEAACVLLRLQSQRAPTLAPLVSVGAKSFELAGHFDGHLMELRYGGLRRKLRFDQMEQRIATEYLRVARVVSFANIDVEMVRGGSDARRRYLDFVGSQIDPVYRPTLRAYERSLRSRNALLKAAQPRMREVAAYDPPLIAHGTQLAAMRAKMVERLAPFVAAAYAEISNSKEDIAICFSPGNENDFAADLAGSREKEIRLRQTVVGPHRDDVDLSVNEMTAQSYASEGQQRTLALALKIAQARMFAEEGGPPLLLIDDIFGELDLDRRHALLACLPDDSQKFVTATARQWGEEFGDSITFTLQDRQLQRG